MRVRKALVTGGTGFVGSRLIPLLLDRGVEVRAVIRSPRRSGLLPRAREVETVIADITDPSTLAGIADGCDVVFHLAAEGHVSAISEEALARFFLVNVTGTGNLIRACAASGGVERFVHFSSTAAMGLIRRPLVSEADEPQPATPYQRSKRESETAALIAGRETGVPVLIVRPCMIYGIGALGEFGKMARMMRKGRFPRVGSGRNLTPLVHVDDVAAAAVAAGERGVPGETYLIASSRSPGLAELRDWIMEGWGSRAPYPYVPVWFMYAAAWGFELLAQVTGRAPIATRRNIANTVYDREFSIDKARRELAWEPVVDLREGVIETVRWLRDDAK